MKIYHDTLRHINHYDKTGHKSIMIHWNTKSHHGTMSQQESLILHAVSRTDARIPSLVSERCITVGGGRGMQSSTSGLIAKTSRLYHQIMNIQEAISSNHQH